MNVDGPIPNANLYSPNNDVGQEKNESLIKGTVNKTQSSANRLIFLTGTSTAGKSSIMTAFASHAENALELGADDFRETRCAELMKKHFKADYAILSEAVDDKNLFRLINSHPDFVEKNPHLFFKASSTSEQREAAFSVYKPQKFYDDIQNMLTSNKASQDEEHFSTILSQAKNKTVIFDTPNSMDFFNYLKEHPCDKPIQRFLVYAPLPELIRRLPGRNAVSEQTGNEVNKRQYIDILKQFKDLYSKAEPNQIEIATLKKKDITAIFKQNGTIIDQENANAKDDDRINENDYLKHFGLDPLDSEETEVPITMNKLEEFQGIFRTGTHQPADVTAQQLNDYKWSDISHEKRV